MSTCRRIKVPIHIHYNFNLIRRVSDIFGRFEIFCTCFSDYFRPKKFHNVHILGIRVFDKENIVSQTSEIPNLNQKIRFFRT